MFAPILIGIIVIGVLMIIAALVLYLFNKAGTAKIKIKDWVDLDIPASLLMALFGVILIGGGYYFYTPIIEKENTSLHEQNDKLDKLLKAAEAASDKIKEKLTAAEDERDEARKKAAELDRNNQAIGVALDTEAAQRRAAEATAKGAWLAFNRYELNDLQRAAFDKLAVEADKLNDGLTYLHIALTPWPKLDGIKAVATFEIYRKDYEKDSSRDRGAGLFEFPLQRITISDDYNGRLATIIQDEVALSVCRAAQAALVQGIPLADAIRQIPKVTGMDLNATSPIIGQLTEFAYVQMRLKILAGHSLVLVRGYADGEVGPWREPLGPAPRTLMVHPNVDPYARDPEKALTFRSILAPVQLGRADSKGATYGNTDLPDLRASAVEQILTPLIDGCRRMGGTAAETKGSPPKVELLDGQVYSQSNMPIDRKARVYVQAYLDEN